MTLHTMLVSNSVCSIQGRRHRSSPGGTITDLVIEIMEAWEGNTIDYLRWSEMFPTTTLDTSDNGIHQAFNNMVSAWWEKEGKRLALPS